MIKKQKFKVRIINCGVGKEAEQIVNSVIEVECYDGYQPISIGYGEYCCAVLFEMKEQ